MSARERREIRVYLRAAGLQPPERMVAGGDERTVDSEFTRDLEVVQRIAHEENFSG